MRIIKYCLLAMLWPAMNGYGQPPPPVIRPLTIGDTVPDIEITNLYNYPVSKVHLSELKGHLVILDFWSSWCGACIESFPKMQRLEKDFGGELKVLLLDTYPGDDEKRAITVFRKIKERTGKPLMLPYALQQSAIAGYFPFRFVPHYVWIDKRGIVVAITSPTEVTSGNISLLLHGRKINLHTKQDMMSFNSKKPLFVNGNGDSGKPFLFRSILTGYVEGLGNHTGLDRDSIGRITRFYALNGPVYTLLKTAYPFLSAYPPNRVLIETRNNHLFAEDAASGSSLYNNSFCYEISFAPASWENLRNYIRQDLNRYFRIRVIKRDREIPCLILENSENLKKRTSNSMPPEVDIDTNSLKQFLHNEPVSVLIEILNSLPQFKQLPVIDATHLQGNISLELPASFPDLDLAELKSFLVTAGFRLSTSKRKISVAVITDK